MKHSLALLLVVKKYLNKVKNICFHEWILGSYVWPVWGRTERHCIKCKKIQYRDNSGKWVTSDTIK